MKIQFLHSSEGESSPNNMFCFSYNRVIRLPRKVNTVYRHLKFNGFWVLKSELPKFIYLVLNEAKKTLNDFMAFQGDCQYKTY